MIDTEQSRVLNCHRFCILISKVILTSCCFCLATVVLMPFVAFSLGLVWFISVRVVTV